MNPLHGRFAPNRCALCVVALFGIVAHAQVGDRSDLDRSAPPEHWTLPDARVHTPEESLALFETPPDFRVELVAAEPLVQDPIFLQFDERGRMWVLEWPSYNWKLRDVIPGLEKLPPPASRVVLLEDSNGDGRMDRRTVFLEGFDWPRGLQVMRDGALVLMLPELIFAHDADNDGRSEREDRLVEGLEIPANPHAAQSNLLRGIDNWVYGSKFPRRMRDQDGTWVFEPNLSMRGQWGLSQDNFGRLFYASNGDHLRGDLVPGHYFTRNPNYTRTAGVDVKYAGDQTTWPPAATPGVNRRNQLRDKDGTLQVFTANTAPAVYRGDQFPPEYVGNVFLGEAAGRFLRRERLTESDGILTARNAYPDREFIASRDERFRPVFTANGPDGSLYIADMHRGIIEGDIFVTSFLRHQVVSRRLQHPFHGMGRIYRVVHTQRPRGNWPMVERGNIAGWVDVLAHPNGFWRDTAQRLLVEKADPRVVPALRRMALQHADALARLHALWTLEGLRAIDAPLVVTALSDPAPQNRIAALRISEPLLADESVAKKVLSLVRDERVEVRRQLGFTLGESRAPAFERGLLELLRSDGNRPVFVEAALSGLRNREFAVLQMLLHDPRWSGESPGASRVVAALAEAVNNSGRSENLRSLIHIAADNDQRPLWLRLALLDGLTQGRKPASPPVDALSGLEASVESEVRLRAAAVRKAWTATAGSAKSPTRALSGATMERGRAMYAVCAACHGPEGKGQAAIAPPLEGSKIVAGPEEELVRGILNGRNLDRANPAYPDMPPLAGLADEDIAAIATYVRARWGGGERAISPGQVRQIRARNNAEN